MRKKSFLGLFLSTMMLVPIGASAQVTIGSGNLPSKWSLLYLDASEQRRALHNARLTTAQRDALVTPNCEQTVQDEAMGLLLFNTTTQCLEFWNGSQWVSLCDGDSLDPCEGFGETMNTVFCRGSTIDSLNIRAREAGSRGTIQWFASAVDGNQLSDYYVLAGLRYYADNCYGTTYRVPVPVTLINCNIAPITGFVTAWTNAMYDFQAQTLSFIGTDNATSWQWQVSGNGGATWQSISGATSPAFTIPSGFMYSSYTNIAEGIAGQPPNAPVVVGSQTREFAFRVVRTNPSGTMTTPAFNMLFIRTNTSGFAHEAVPSLVLNRTAGASGDIRVALLNLGAVNDNSLGNFFQWGRRADGHEQIVWAKNPANGANMFGAGTSAFVARGGFAPAVDANGQVIAPAFVGNFITHTGDWGAENVASNNRWGATTVDVTRANAPTSIAHWAFPANNPCPAGWRVPSRFEFWDINNGNGVSAPVFTDWNITTASGNTWTWRPGQNGAVGGAIVTSRNGEALFLPAVGWRNNFWNAALNQPGIGLYWTSTFFSTIRSWDLVFNILGMNLNIDGNHRAGGFSVRCIAE